MSNHQKENASETPEGYEWKWFVVPRHQDVIARYTLDELIEKFPENKRQRGNRHKNFEKNVLVDINIAPEELVKNANNADYTYLDRPHNMRKFRVEKVKRLVPINPEKANSLVDPGEFGIAEDERVGTGIESEARTSPQSIAAEAIQKKQPGKKLKVKKDR